MRHVQNPGLVRKVNSTIFKDIDAYSAALTDMQLGGGGKFILPTVLKMARLYTQELLRVQNMCE